MENMHEDELEIDLMEIFSAIKKKLFLILAAGLLCGCISCVGTMLFITPTYKSTFSMLAISKESSLTSMADLQLGTQLVNHYKVLIQSTPVLETVIENLGLEMGVKDLRGSITIENPTDTRILEVSVVNESPEMAKKIIDELARESSLYIADKMEVMTPKIIEQGELPTQKASPNVKKNTVLGILLGLFAAGGLVVLVTMLNDTIKTEEDITKYLGVSVLASVPDRKDYLNNKKRRAKRRKRQRSHVEGRK